MDNYIFYGRPKGRGIKLHLGCGDYWLDGFLNIDFNIYGGTDMILDIREKLPFQDGVVERIEAYEVVEHLSQSEINNALNDWFRLLIDGGGVRISVPDMDGLVKMYQIDRDKAIQQMYGFEQCQTHKWGYTQESLQKLFLDHGFKNVIVTKGELKERPGEPKLLVEATR